VMGLFLAQSGQSEQSIAAYKQSAKLAPQSAYPHHFLAQIHERANHLEMAIKEYREAVRLDPFLCAGADQLGVAYQEQGRLEMAIPQYREVIKLNPNDSVATQTSPAPLRNRARWSSAAVLQGGVAPEPQGCSGAFRAGRSL